MQLDACVPASSGLNMQGVSEAAAAHTSVQGPSAYHVLAAISCRQAGGQSC